MRVLNFVLIGLIIFTASSQAVSQEYFELFVDRLPFNSNEVSNVGRWSEERKAPVHFSGEVEYMKELKHFRFRIPVRYVVRDSSGQVDILSSLETWRRSTPIAEGNPRTLSGGTFYPFYDQNGDMYYADISYIYENMSRFPSVTLYTYNNNQEGPQVLREGFNAHDLPARPQTLNIPSPQTHSSNISRAVRSIVGNDFEAQLNRIAQNGRITCNRTDNIAQCMVCNCIREARGEPEAGQVAVGRVVLTRVARTGFPNNVCSVVWARSAFSWTSAPGSTHRGSDVANCVRSMRTAVREGIWGWDHFYANSGPNAVSAPSWARVFIRKNGSTKLGHHLFLNSGLPFRSEYVTRHAEYQSPTETAQGVL